MSTTPSEPPNPTERPQPVHAQPLEYDETGVPYYKWPPFPGPPPDVEVMPFQKFKPKGIQIRMALDDDDDGVELDGEGIPTVALKVKHASADPEADGEDGGAGSKKKGKKKKKFKKANGEEIVVRTTWYEDWEEGEDLRSNYRYDLMLPREDRFVHASEDFKRSRSWPPTSTEVGQLYDQFRMYVGLIGSLSNPFVSKYKQPDLGFDEEEEDSEGDVNMANGREVLPEPAKVKVGEWDASKHQPADAVLRETEEQYANRVARKLVAKETRMETFLNDPYASIRVYLTSYARDRGFYWSEMKLRDAPLLVSFFIRFLVRNNALPECQRSLKNAVKLLELAKEELPRTKVIATAIPDESSLCCASAFGSQIPQVDWGNATLRERADDDDGRDERMNKKVKLDDVPKIVEPTNWTEFTVPETEDHPAARIFEINDDDVKPEDPANSAPQWTDDNTWYTKSVETGDVDNGGWGSVGTANDGWITPTHFLMSFLGPTTITLTHAIGYVEESVRQIISWTAPGTHPAGEVTMSDPLKSLVAVEMGPYKAIALSEPDRTSIRAPKLLKDPHATSTSTSDVTQDGDEVNVAPHDSRKDRITVLMLPSTAKTLLKGIGINATWIQVAPRKTKNIGAGKRGGKGKGKAKKEEPQVWWYMEQVVQVFPSFWEELPASSRNALNGRDMEKNTA